VSVDVINLQDAVPVRKAEVARAARQVMRDHAEPGLDVNVVLTDNRMIRRLNRQFLARDAVTDVLAFPDGATHPHRRGKFLGEVVVSVERAREVARRLHKSVRQEVLLYVVHGLLHLLGYDDHAADDSRRMRACESRCLRKHKKQPGAA